MTLMNMTLSERNWTQMGTCKLQKQPEHIYDVNSEDSGYLEGCVVMEREPRRVSRCW